MRISRLKVSRYRSLEEVDIDLQELNTFTGKNNHGKTNLFGAIEWLYNARESPPELYFLQDKTKPITVTLHYQDVSAADLATLTDTHRSRIEGLLAGETEFAVTKSSSDHKRAYVVQGINRGNPTGIEAAMSPFLPRLEYIKSDTKLEDITQYKTTSPVAAMLADLMETWAAGEEYAKFDEQVHKIFDEEGSQLRTALAEIEAAVSSCLGQQFPDGVSVKFSVRPPRAGELLKNMETVVDDGVATRGFEKGDGMQRAIVLAILQAHAMYRKARASVSTLLFMIDEAELHLHPTAQRQLMMALADISRTDQVLLSTHSSVMVTGTDQAHGLFSVEKRERTTSVTPIAHGSRDSVVFGLLGGSPADLLLPSNFLVVEGASECAFIADIVSHMPFPEMQSVLVIAAHGDATSQGAMMDSLNRTMIPLIAGHRPIYRDKVVVVLDRPNDSQKASYRKFRKAYKDLDANNQIFELPHRSIEECYPDPWRKSREQVDAMDGAAGEKVWLAHEAGKGITRAQLEEHMPVLYSALLRCVELAIP
jgi:hypothetical protein